MTDAIHQRALAALPQAIDDHLAGSGDVYAFLAAQDAKLKRLLTALKGSDHETLAALDTPELGAIPFLAHNPEDPQVAALLADADLAPLTEAKNKGLIPAPTVALEDFTAIEPDLARFIHIMSDGTVMGFAPYEQLNYHWGQCITNGLLTKHVHGKAPFGDHMPEPIPMPEGDITIAIPGDWGTGEGAAVAVKSAIMSDPPDYLIHLGDVYYTGTPQSTDKFYFDDGTEQAHLVDFWPDMPKGRSFTLNSNHEMYPGAWGLMDVALACDSFAAQQGKTYCLLENSTWQIFALDSAYDAPDFMVMYGALNQQQFDFVQKYRDPGKKVIVMTHHNPYDMTGTVEQVKGGVSLLKDVKAALGGDLPDYWYFGHEHIGVAYKAKGGCLMRCTGHASMPIGAPYGLVSNRGTTPPYKDGDYIDGIDFVASTPLDPNTPHGLIQNGFMRITLCSDGTLREGFYDQDGRQTWSSG